MSVRSFGAAAARVALGRPVLPVAAAVATLLVLLVPACAAVVKVAFALGAAAWWACRRESGR